MTNGHNIPGNQSLISIVIPVFNEAPNIMQIAEQIMRIVAPLPYAFELIFVDDGSTDNTLDEIKTARRMYPSICFLKFSRNFGHQAALLAGLKIARGQCIITMDGDLQHPPEIIPVLLAAWREGYQVVNTVRTNDPSLPNAKRYPSHWYYRIFKRLSGLNLSPGMADFRLLDRVVVNQLLQLDERAIFVRGMLQWMGFSQTTIPFKADARYAGATKFNTVKMLRLAFDGITSFSATPLRLATLLGFIFSTLSFGYLAFALFGWLFTKHNIVGWTSVIGSVLFLGGVQLICLGIIGEYVSRIFLEVKKRPHYIIAEQSEPARD